jgi:lysophospholipase L1-like esterase
MKFLLRPALSLLLMLCLSASAETPNLGIPDKDDGMAGTGPVRRYDWFRGLWNEKRAAWAKRLEADRGAVVFLGDSITQGWGDDFGGSFPGMKAANRGISGDTTRGMLHRLEHDVLALQPAAVVLLMGTNDLEEKAAPEVIAGNLKLILAALHAHNATMPIVLCQVFPSAASKSRPADLIRKVNELYAATVKGNAQVTFVETWPMFADAAGDAKPAEFPDLLHPNKAGYDRWAMALRPVLATLGFLEKEPEAFTPEPGSKSLFNGKDLTGWGYRDKSGAWESFDGKEQSSDGRYAAIGGRLVVKTPPEYSRITQLWTAQAFPESFELKLEFRATPNADSGIFIRGPQLQCRDYVLAGPWKNLPNYRPQDWNEVVVTVRDGVARCTCNGDVLDEAFKVPATGPIGLEGDRGQMEYRRIRIRELP